MNFGLNLEKSTDKRYIPIHENSESLDHKKRIVLLCFIT